MRENKRATKATIYTKQREGATLLSFIPDLCLCQHLYFSLQRVFISLFAYLFGDLFIIELGLYIPRMSLLKSALGLHEQASWMHPTSSIGGLSYTHSSMCILLCGNPYYLHSFDCKAFSCLTVTFSALQAFLLFGLPNPHLCSIFHNLMVPNQVHAHWLS